MTTERSIQPDESEKPTRVPYGWLSILVAVVFGVIYADILWNAIGDLVNLPPAFGSLTPWWLLIVDVVVPVVAFVIAFFLGRRRSLGARSLFFLIGLGVVSCSTVASIA